MYKTLLLFLFFSTIAFSHNDSIIKGRIIAEFENLEGVHIINLTSIAGTVSDYDGYFYIKAKEADTLLFSAVFLEKKKYRVTKNDIAQNLILVPINIVTEYLKEVVKTEYKNINAVSLGILPSQPKSYTKAERNLLAAETFHWYSPLLIPFGGMSVEGLLNAISGRTNMLKKELKIERKEILQENISIYFNDEFIANRLLIPEEYISGFKFYAVESDALAEAMKAKNKTQAAFILHQLALDYLTLKEIPLKLEDRKPLEKSNNEK
jgi:hypothetical protein